MKQVFMSVAIKGKQVRHILFLSVQSQKFKLCTERRSEYKITNFAHKTLYSGIIGEQHHWTYSEQLFIKFNLFYV